MDISKIRVPWRDDLMNVKILFSCWPKYFYTHIWPQNIEKWGKTVILLVKWWISNFRPPSGEPFFQCLRHRPGVRQIIPPKSDTCVPQKPKMNPPGWGHGVHSSCWNLEGKYFFIFLSFCRTFFYFLFSFFCDILNPPSHIFQTKKFITITLFMIFNKME